MKKMICALCAIFLLLSLSACRKKPELFYPTPEDVTVESLKASTSPLSMLSHAGAFQIDFRNDDAPNAGAYASTVTMRYRSDVSRVLINQSADYDAGDHTLLFYTSDQADMNLFRLDNGVVDVLTLSEREIQNELEQSLFGFDFYDCEITSSQKNGETYTVDYDVKSDDRVIQHVTMDVDPVNGAVNSAVFAYYDNDVLAGETKVTVTYDKDIQIDQSPRDMAIEQGLYDPDQAKTPPASTSENGGFTFAAKDLDGNLMTHNDFADASLIMVNFWEPWCPPCLDEMPDLELLYEDYRDTGLVILGVYSTPDSDDDVRDAISKTGVTYPIVQCDSRLALYQTDSVPTTIFVDGNGNVLSDEPFVGSRSYEDWLTIIGTYMELE